MTLSERALFEQALAEAGPAPMSMSDRAARYAEAAERTQRAGNAEAFTDLIVAARACAAIDRVIARGRSGGWRWR